MSDLTKRFSDDAKRALQFAVTLAADWGHTYVGSEHLLTGIIAVSSETGSTAAKLLREQGVTEAELKKRILAIVGTGTRMALCNDDLTPTCRRILGRASQSARASKSGTVDPERLLIALLKEECVGRRLAENCGADPSGLLEILEDLYGRGSYEPPRIEPEKTRKQTPLLDKNAVNLTEKALSGGVDPVIGREKEEEEIIGILLRRTKNNPCLVGEAGVGKTAVVESVAARIAEGRVPDALLGKRIMSLELASVVAGTKYRGEFEEKIRNILSEVKEADDVILFVDEIHTIVGAGAAEGAIDASNILKPSLARGELKLIGATTLKEYKKCIEKDAALERRFRKVEIGEPDCEACISILQGLKGRYEGFHGVRILPEALDAAARLSDRYIGDRRLPDKAIDLIDEASARKRILGGRTVSAKDVEATLRAQTGIPLGEKADGEARVLRLEKTLRENVIGQDAAIEAIVSGIRYAETGLRENERPLRSFLFLGPSGVGKTEAAKTTAEVLFGKDGFLRIDMTEYSEAHSVSRLIGAPPGYAGYDDGGLLTERVRRHPHSLILFDEAEKAHPEVRALLLQLLDEGKLTDSSGLAVSFRNTVVILTVSGGEGAAGIGFSAGTKEKASVRKRAEDLLSRELTDRVDEVVPFSALTPETLTRIASERARTIEEKLAGQGICVKFDEAFLQKAVESAAADGNRGAREVCRRVMRWAEEALAGVLTEGSAPQDADLTVTSENGAPCAKISRKTY